MSHHYQLRDLELNTAELLSIVDQGASGNEELAPRIVLVKRKPGATAPVAKGAGMPTMDEIKAKLSAAEWEAIQEWAQQLVAQAKDGGSDAEESAEGEAPVAKRKEPAVELPVEIRKMLDAKDAELKAARDERVAVEKRIAAIEDERLTETIVSKVRESMAAVPGASVPELAAILKSASKGLAADEYKKLETVLKSASAVIQKSALLREVGGAGAPAADSPEGEINELAKALVEKDPKLTIQKARVAVIDAHPELYERYMIERHGAGKGR